MAHDFRILSGQSASHRTNGADGTGRREYFITLSATSQICIGGSRPGLKNSNAKTQVFHLNVPFKHLEAVLNCLFEGKERALPLLLTLARATLIRPRLCLYPARHLDSGWHSGDGEWTTFFYQIVVHDLHKDGFDDTLWRKCHSIPRLSACLGLPLNAGHIYGPVPATSGKEIFS